MQQYEKIESYTVDLMDVVVQPYNLIISVNWEAEVKKKKRLVQG